MIVAANGVAQNEVPACLAHTSRNSLSSIAPGRSVVFVCAGVMKHR